MSTETNNDAFIANMLATIKEIQGELNELKIIKRGIVKKSTRRKPARRTVKRKPARRKVKRKPARRTVKRKVPPTITISILDVSCPNAINLSIFDVICNLGS